MMASLHSNLVKFMSLDRVIAEEGGAHNIDNVKAAFNYLKNAKTLGSSLLRWI